MYHIVMCDDEKEILQTISHKVKACFEKSGVEAEYTALSEAQKLITLLETEKADILFLDIDMPYFSGMDIAGMITERGLQTLLVFVTSHDALVYQTFVYRPFGFIRKTYFDDEIEDMIERLARELAARREEIIFTRGQEIIKIRIEDIYFAESEGNYVNIRVRSNKENSVRENNMGQNNVKEGSRVEKCRDTLANISTELKGKGFIRCHKGYLVNGKYIMRVRSNELELSDGTVIPIGRSYEKEVKQTILELMRK